MRLTTFHNLNVNATVMWTLGQANWQIRFPSQICLNNAYLGRIRTDPPSSLIFHNFNLKWIVKLYFYLIDGQLGSDINIFKLGWNLVILKVWCLSFDIFTVRSVIFINQYNLCLYTANSIENQLNQLFPKVAFTDYFAWTILEDSEATCL